MSAIKILDMSGRPVLGCCKFPFGEFTFSVSTVFPTASDRILVTNKKGESVFSCFTVEEAVAHVTALAEKDHE